MDDLVEVQYNGPVRVYAVRLSERRSRPTRSEVQRQALDTTRSGEILTVFCYIDGPVWKAAVIALNAMHEVVCDHVWVSTHGDILMLAWVGRWLRCKMQILSERDDTLVETKYFDRGYSTFELHHESFRAPTPKHTITMPWPSTAE